MWTDLQQHQNRLAGSRRSHRSASHCILAPVQSCGMETIGSDPVVCGPRKSAGPLCKPAMDITGPACPCSTVSWVNSENGDE
eukprot:759578-Hanusia_phi.AAC.4